MNEIRAIQASQMKEEVDQFKVGDTVRVHFKIVEGKTERVQAYEGLVICIKKLRGRKNLYGSEKFLRRWGRTGIPPSLAPDC